MVDPRPPISQDPQLWPFLPLLYVAWADGELGDDELTRLHRQVAEQTTLAPAARAALQAWLDPSSPPSPSTLQAWLAELQRVAARPCARCS